MKKKAKLIHLSEATIENLTITAIKKKSKFKPFVESLLENYKIK